MEKMTIREYDLLRRANLAHALGGAPPDLVSEVQGEIDRRRGAGPSASAIGAHAGAMMGADTTGLAVEVVVRMRQVPTSFVHLLDPEATPLVTFRVRSHRDRKARLRLSSRVEGFSAEAIETLELPPGGEVVERSQLPVFLLDRIADVTEARAAALYVRVEDLDGRVEHEGTYRVVLLPRTTAYIAVEDGAGGTLDLAKYLAAWVTPNAPAVMQVIREAAALHADHTLVGYQPEAAPDLADLVTAQVAAIYRALQERGLTYVSSITAWSLRGDAFVQRIRLPRESLETRSANCVDGTVLVASLLEAASLNAAIVLVPGHALVAYERFPYSSDWAFLETTLIGYGAFEDALAAGEAAAARYRDCRAPSRLQILPLATLRRQDGVFPME